MRAKTGNDLFDRVRISESTIYIPDRSRWERVASVQMGGGMKTCRDQGAHRLR